MNNNNSASGSKFKQLILLGDSDNDSWRLQQGQKEELQFVFHDEEFTVFTFFFLYMVNPCGIFLRVSVGSERSRQRMGLFDLSCKSIAFSGPNFLKKSNVCIVLSPNSQNLKSLLNYNLIQLIKKSCIHALFQTK
ncbi:hypothetical protein RFI_28517 [Reticulomyxa filosa]|uniref:Uncharacterized protein n=1 Tax=Reticulomyxa filosa TaxID=46433 RepID=X6M798_RETFI|nr:hypothetical protein RFI_28517 [Reticulomyxa filosa]|eukprot:ETO08870.1 hypothetical protein RFI_28517 [Reticulomyxa filosa]